MKRHWYTIRLKYVSKGGKVLFSNTADIGLKNQADILDRRAIKKVALDKRRNPFHLRDEVKPLLCNGEIQVVPIAYLGRFRSDEQSFTSWMLEAVFGDAPATYLMVVSQRRRE